ncbi:hypothetical protein ACH5RR_037076 [Cinchona calisaya]|uniref:Uncharacterized protein n=1 Tax=Cinchona calisaya TaxID=153742 RepID=A0ABD2Y874_9GENT
MEGLEEIMKRFSLSSKEVDVVDLGKTNVERIIRDCQKSLIEKVIGEKLINFVGMKNFVNQVGSIIGGTAGEVLEVLMSETGGKKGKHLKVLVLVDITKPLRRDRNCKSRNEAGKEINEPQFGRWMTSNGLQGKGSNHQNSGTVNSVKSSKLSKETLDKSNGKLIINDNVVSQLSEDNRINGQVLVKNRSDRHLPEVEVPVKDNVGDYVLRNQDIPTDTTRKGTEATDETSDELVGKRKIIQREEEDDQDMTEKFSPKKPRVVDKNTLLIDALTGKLLLGEEFSTRVVNDIDGSGNPSLYC